MPTHTAAAGNDLAGEIDRLKARVVAAPADATSLANLIALLATAKRDEEAALHAARLLALRPAHRRALRALTRSPRAEVDIIAGWHAFAATAPDDVEPWLQIARLAARAEDRRTSLDACEEALLREPDHPEILSLKIAALDALGGGEAAIAIWSTLHDVDPDRALAILTRAIDAGEGETAAAMLGEALASGPLAGEMERQALRLRCRLSVDAYSWELSGEDAASAEAFEALTRLEPGEAEHADGLRRAIGRLRERVETAADAPDALAEAARVLGRLDPADANAQAMLGRLAARDGRWGQAAQAFDQAVALGANTPGLRADQARALAGDGQFARAARVWEAARAAVGDDPGSAEPLDLAGAEVRQLALAAYENASAQGDWPQAWAAGEALATLGDDSSASQARTAALLKATAEALLAQSDTPGPSAIDLARLYLGQSPGDEAARLVLARALSLEGRNEEALAVWRDLGAARPDSVEPGLQTARIAMLLGETDLGRQAAERVLALDPAHAEAGGLKTYFDEFARLG
ncbi:MAG: hypothetical protein ACR2FH_09425 [Caulobacteraceae bacterium]